MSTRAWRPADWTPPPIPPRRPRRWAVRLTHWQTAISTRWMVGWPNAVVAVAAAVGAGWVLHVAFALAGGWLSMSILPPEMRPAPPAERSPCTLTTWRARGGCHGRVPL